MAQEPQSLDLDEIIRIGLMNNLTLLAEAREVDARKAAFEASTPLFNPELEFQAGSGKSHDGEISRNTKGISLTQSLENPLKRKYRLQIAESDWHAAEYHYQALKTAFVSDLKGIFHRILLIREEIGLAEKNAASLEEIQRLTERRARLGEVKELEGIKLRVEALKTRNGLARLQAELELAREDLNKNLGNSLPPEYSLQGNLEYVRSPVEESALVEKALQSHPRIKQREMEQELSENRWNYVRWQRFPDLKLAGFMNDELHGKVKGVGISLEIPLWNFRTKEIAEARSLYEKKRTELNALRQEVGTDVRSRISRLKLSEKTIELFEEELLKQADLSLTIAEVSYREGEISLVDYLDSQRTHYGIMKDYRSSLYQWALDRFALEKSVGAELK